MSVSSTSTPIGDYGTAVADERIRLRAHGHVQGVFFRDSVRREASRRGVAGWARNCADGSAEVVLEGPAGEVAAMVEYVRRGPGHSEVAGVETASEPVQGMSGFDVR
jgi:acylphosphatase